RSRPIRFASSSNPASSSASRRWWRRRRAERPANNRRVALRGGAPFFLLRLVTSPSALAGLRAALALQGNGLQPIPAARCLAPLTAAELSAPDRQSIKRFGELFTKLLLTARSLWALRVQRFAVLHATAHELRPVGHCGNVLG